MTDWLALALRLQEAPQAVPIVPKSPKPAPTDQFGDFGTFGTSSADFDERAATLEYEGGLSRSWAEAWTGVEVAGPPAGMTPESWHRLQDDIGRFVDQWGAQALRMGWTAADLFGAAPSHAGLVWALRGRRVVALTTTFARLDDGERLPRGGCQDEAQPNRENTRRIRDAGAAP